MVVQITGSNIKREQSIRYLGVIVDENLKWKSHIRNISSKISRNIGIMGRTKYFLSSRELLFLYNAFVLPYLNYCAVVWGRNYITNISNLVKLQKRALRIIDKKPYTYPSGVLFKKYKILKLPELVQEQSIMILLAYVNKTLPSSVANLFQYHRPNNTRLSKHFFVPYAKTNYRTFAISYFAPKVWNAIVSSIFEDIEDVPKNKYTLKKYVRAYLLDKY